jgi:hypothetical protein
MPLRPTANSDNPSYLLQHSLLESWN